MRLSESRDIYNRHTTSLSTASRQLAFAGIAVVWIFVSKVNGAFVIEEALVWPLFLFVSGLASDLLQYMWASAAWGVYSRRKELDESITKDSEFLAPKEINWPTIGFFWVKSALVILGYILLMKALWP